MAEAIGDTGIEVLSNDESTLSPREIRSWRPKRLEAAREMASRIAVIDTFSVALTKRAISRMYQLMGRCETLNACRNAKNSYRYRGATIVFSDD